MLNNKTNSSNTSKGIIILVVVALIILVVLAIWGGLFERKEPEKEPFIDLGDPTLEVRLLTGVVTEVFEGVLIIDVPSILGVEVPENSPLRRREILVNDDTRIMVSQEKATAQYQEELETYQEKRANGEPAFPPSPRNELSIALSDLSVGDYVQISGRDSGDIKEETSVIAAEITKR